jgi:hypothetical protein
MPRGNLHELKCQVGAEETRRSALFPRAVSFLKRSAAENALRCFCRVRRMGYSREVQGTECISARVCCPRVGPGQIPGRAPARPHNTESRLSCQAADTLGVAIPSREQGPTKYDYPFKSTGRVVADVGWIAGSWAMSRRASCTCRLSSYFTRQPMSRNDCCTFTRFTASVFPVVLRTSDHAAHAGGIGRPGHRSACCARLQAGKPPPIS